MTVRTGDIAVLLRQAEKEGAVVTRSRTGHWKVFNPETNQSACIPATPGDRRSLLNARSRLRHIGLSISSLRRGSGRKRRQESDPAR